MVPTFQTTRSTNITINISSFWMNCTCTCTSSCCVYAYMYCLPLLQEVIACIWFN
jgi:hypothetical protein